MIDLLISSVGAVYSSTNIFFKKSVRQAREHVMNKEISIPSKLVTLKDFVSVQQNRIALRQLYYEVLAIRALFIACTICSVLVFLGVLILMFEFDLQSPNPGIAESMNKAVYALVVISLLCSFACSFLAGGLMPDE